MNIHDAKTVVVLADHYFGKGYSIEEAFENWVLARNFNYDSRMEKLTVLLVDAEYKDVTVNEMGAVCFPSDTETKPIEFSFTEKIKKAMDRVEDLKMKYEDNLYELSCMLSN